MSAATATARHRCLCITGPTAAGKTDLALSLARECPIEIISMDSVMVYRGMDIGTAKPPPEILRDVRHHLIDIRDPEDTYSAGQFAADAARLIGEISARRHLPVIVGGTMLYMKALRDGIAPLPARDPDVRAAIDAEAEALGWEAMHARLERVDPDAARRIDPADRQRIQRALEVHSLTGRSLTELQQGAGESSGVAAACFALLPPDRQSLGEAIERRFRAMVERGFVDEVARLRRTPGLTADMPAMRAVGYRQIWAHLDGKYAWAEAERKAIAATRQLAKRQLTWLRGDAGTQRLDSADRVILKRLVIYARETLSMY